jgi:hypothetical protein
MQQFDIYIMVNSTTIDLCMQEMDITRSMIIISYKVWGLAFTYLDLQVR